MSSHSSFHPKPPALAFAALLIAWLALLLAPGQAQALCFTTGAFQESELCWNPVAPFPEGFDIEHVLWNPDAPEYLAVGTGGAILASPDGLDWTPRDSGIVQNLYGGLWDGSRYVVVGDGGVVLTSPDGIDWTAQVTDNRLRLLDVAINGAGSLYVIVGERGVVLSSPDAENWTETTVLSLSRRPALYDVLWDNGRFIAVGSSATIISSSNGVDWVEHNYTPLAPDVPPPPILRGLAVSSGSQYVALGSSGTVFRSNDGFNWEEGQPIDAEPDARIRAVVWIGDRFIAVGDDGDPQSPLILASQTGQQWAPITPAGISPDTLKTIVFNGTGLVTAGNESMLRAADTNLDWEVLAPDPDLTATINDLLIAGVPGPLFVAAGEDGALMSSADGLSWTREDSGTDDSLNGLAWNGDADDPQIVAAGDNGVLLYSANGSDWTGVPAISGTLNGITYGNGTFIAVGDGGTILTSADGVAWATIAGIPDVDLNDIAYGLFNNSPRFVAVGAGGTVLVSNNDGANWQDVSANSGVNSPLNAVVWNADDDDALFIAVGQTAGVSPLAVAIYSPSGAGWDDAIVPAQTPALLDAAWNGSQFVAVSSEGSFLRSQTGRGWAALGTPVEDAGSPTSLNSILWSGERFLAAGVDGRILGSGGVDISVAVDTDTSESEDDDPSFADAGLEKTYRFTVTNIGNLDAVNVQFTYTPPPEVTEPLTDPVSIPDNWICTVTGGGAGLACSTGRLDAGTGEAATIEVAVVMPEESDTTITHFIEAPAGIIDDTQPANNELTFATRIGPREAPGLPSPDTEFSSEGAFGSLDAISLGLLLILAVSSYRRRAVHRLISTT